ncbi:Hypothetical predicted protein [Mytilus galloprovincialis]|uniref:Uncharacterized protein n=1 Tax=Mytilus galloprovincialis TaxID=29158 RepID=A0A8B6BL86_MYTGA|nr:Hypothetical predicted protein [Mytilus galloprovincialis]
MGRAGRKEMVVQIHCLPLEKGIYRESKRLPYERHIKSFLKNTFQRFFDFVPSYMNRGCKINRETDTHTEHSSNLKKYISTPRVTGSGQTKHVLHPTVKPTEPVMRIERPILPLF